MVMTCATHVTTAVVHAAGASPGTFQQRGMPHSQELFLGAHGAPCYHKATVKLNEYHFIATTPQGTLSANQQVCQCTDLLLRVVPRRRGAPPRQLCRTAIVRHVTAQSHLHVTHVQPKGA